MSSPDDVRLLPLEQGGSIALMPVTKLSVSVEEDLAEVVRAAAADEGVTISAWLADAASHRIRNRFLGEAVAKALKEHDSLDEDALQALAAQARSIATVTSPPHN